MKGYGNLEDDNLPHLMERSWTHLVDGPSLVSSTEARGENGLMEYLHKDCKHWEYFSTLRQSIGQNVYEDRQERVRSHPGIGNNLSFFKLQCKPGSAIYY